MVRKKEAGSLLRQSEIMRGSGDVKKSVSGELRQKASDVFEIKFEPDDDHSFVRWQASSPLLQPGATYEVIVEEKGLNPISNYYGTHYTITSRTKFEGSIPEQ